MCMFLSSFFVLSHYKAFLVSSDNEFGFERGLSSSHAIHTAKYKQTSLALSVSSANLSMPDHCCSHCTGFRYKSASGTRLPSSRTRLCRHLSRHASTNCCSVKKRPGHCGPLMLHDCSSPGRAPR